MLGPLWDFAESQILMDKRGERPSYLIYRDVVVRLLKARGIVILISHNNPDLVVNDCANYLIVALDLDNNRGDGVGGLQDSEDRPREAELIVQF